MNRKILFVGIGALVAGILAFVLLVVLPLERDSRAYDEAMARADDESLSYEERMEGVTEYAHHGKVEARRTTAAFKLVGLAMKAHLDRAERYRTVIATARKAHLEGNADAVRIVLARAADLARLLEYEGEARDDEHDLEARLAWPERRRVIVVPDDHATVAGAMAAAGRGDIVRLRRGVHEGPVTLAKGVLLEGEDAAETILRCAPDAGHVIRVEYGHGSVRDLTVEHAGPWKDDLEIAAISLCYGRVDLRNVTVRNACGHGLLIEGEHGLPIEGCRFEGSKYSGIRVYGPRVGALIRRCVSRGNRNLGIWFTFGADGEVTGCTLEENEQSGLGVKDEGTEVVARDNVLRANGHDGIRVREGGRLEAHGNRCLENVEEGVAVWKDGASAELVSNVCSGNGKTGIFVGTHGSVVARDNTCEANGYAGLCAKFEGTSLEATGNRCRENRQSGIYVGAGARATLSENVCEGNTWAGLAVADAGTSVDARKNRCRKNTVQGIAVWGGATGEIVENECRDNENSGISVKGEGTEFAVRDNVCEGNGAWGIYFGEGAKGVANGNRCEGNDSDEVGVEGGAEPVIEGTAGDG